MLNSIPELLAPSGDFTRLKAAVSFGADAVYLAGEEFGMRSAAANFSLDDLEKGVAFAHQNGVKVHVTCNIVPHNEEMKRIPSYLEYLNELGVDAIIASDLGTMRMIRRYAPKSELHVSVQSGIVNADTANAFFDMGAKRVVLARELSLDEIAEIRKETDPALELEIFAHGAMCVGFSARCLLSSYMTGRDANRGDCAQPCRWNYALMEEKRPGQYFPVAETKEGTYILNANDLCMAPYLNQVVLAGVDSIKLEGRAKSHYYTAAVTNAYRMALDSLKGANLTDWMLPEYVAAELNKISHRSYSTGFYFGKPENSQTYESAGYVRDYAVAAIVTGYENGMIICQMKNKFAQGVELDCLEPKNVPFILSVNEMFDENDQPISVAPHPMMTVKIPYPQAVKTGALLRMQNQ